MAEARNQRIRKAMARIASWMSAHGAQVLVDNLAQGASVTELDAYEARIGFPLPDDLRSLWSVHAGQRSERNGFVESLDLYGPGEASAEEESVRLLVESLRADPSSWTVSGVTPAEASSECWLAFAGRSHDDLLLVHAASGRVFRCAGDTPRRVADSILAWIEAYADGVERGDYAVEPGFGDCYLARAGVSDDDAVEAGERSDDDGERDAERDAERTRGRPDVANIVAVNVLLERRWRTAAAHARNAVGHPGHRARAMATLAEALSRLDRRDEAMVVVQTLLAEWLDDTPVRLPGVHARKILSGEAMANLLRLVDAGTDAALIERVLGTPEVEDADEELL
jgi:hypothetical protein